jgi:hypothetical protein
MKKYLILSIYLSFLGILAFGQVKSKKVSILWGKEERESRKSTLNDVVGYDQTGIYAIKTKSGLYGFGSTLTLVHYNNKMSQAKAVKLDLKEQNKSLNFEYILQLHNELYLFSSFRNQKQKKNYLFVQTINKNTLQPAGKPKKIAEIDYSGKLKYNSGEFHYEISRDSSKVLIYYKTPFDKGENEKFGFNVFDSEFTMLWHKEVTLPYKEELFDVEDYEVSNNGNVYLLGLIYKDKRKKKRKGEPNYKYQILNYSNNGESLTEYPVEIKGKFLTDMQIAVNPDQDIICGGFYSNVGSFSIKGSYFLKINGKTKEITHKAFREFGIDFITQNMTSRQEAKSRRKAKKGKDVELYEYDLDDIILREDGGAVLVGEQYYISMVVSTYTTNGVTTRTTSYIYNYNDIIVVNLTPEGNIDWTEKIPKRQSTSNDHGFFSSYALSVVKDKLYFIFNDNPKNLFYKGEGKLYDFIGRKNSLIVMVELDSQGNQTREALFTAREADILTRPKVCEQILPSEMVIYGQRKKSHRFAKVTFLD